MSKSNYFAGTLDRRIFVLLLSIAALVAAGVTQGRAQTMLTRQVRNVTLTGQATILGRLPSTGVMQLDVVLPLRDQVGLDAFIAQVQNPYSSGYRQFLTPAEFTARFGPTQQDYDAVIHYVQSYGMTVVGGSRDGMEVQVKGPVSAVQSAFHVNMLIFQHPTEGRTFYGPDREPSTDLPFALWHVSGLDNYSITHPMYVKKSDYAKANGIDA